MMKKLFSLLFSFMVCVAACHTSKISGNQFKGTISDLTGLDGCGMVIKLDNGNTPQPIILPQGFILQRNKRVSLCYNLLKNKMTTCRSGSAVQITSISYL